MKKQAHETCKHEETIFGICLICKHDTGAIETFKKQRDSQLDKFATIRKNMESK